MRHATVPEAVLSEIERRRLALDALVDRRTFDRALAGLYVQPLCRARILAALAARGLAELLPPAAERVPAKVAP